MDFANIPALVPPPGVQSNFDNPRTLRASFIVINAIFLPLMLLVVAIRLYSRGHIMQKIGWDDCRKSPNATVERALTGDRHMYPCCGIAKTSLFSNEIIAERLFYSLGLSFTQR